MGVAPKKSFEEVDERRINVRRRRRTESQKKVETPSLTMFGFPFAWWELENVVNI